MAGACSFDDDRGLRDEAMFGIRGGVGVARFVTLWTDFTYSSPLQKDTGKAVGVSSLRVLAQVDVTRTPLAPYLLVGGGGTLYAYEDEATTAAGALVAGGGLQYRLGRTSVFAEGKADMSRVRSISYPNFGAPLLSSERRTTWNKSLVAGFGVEF